VWFDVMALLLAPALVTATRWRAPLRGRTVET
jgi:hypothetical protein